MLLFLLSASLGTLTGGLPNSMHISVVKWLYLPMHRMATASKDGTWKYWDIDGKDYLISLHPNVRP